MKRVLLLVAAGAACDSAQPAKTSTGESVAGIDKTPVVCRDPAPCTKK